MKIIIHARRVGSWDYTECGRETIHAMSFSRLYYMKVRSPLMPRCKQCMRKIK